MDAKDHLLLQLFSRHFPNPMEALKRLDNHLETVPLGFDVKSTVRQRMYPSLPHLPLPMPEHILAPSIYYYFPTVNYGTNQAVESNPLHRSYLQSCDGMGLNIGCPVRLLRALDALQTLPKEDKKSPLEELQSHHLNAVEELLWATGWNASATVARGVKFADATGDVDWLISFPGLPIHLEAKFRKSSWPSVTDGPAFSPVGEKYLARAWKKFPEFPDQGVLHVVGITMNGYVTKGIVHLIGAELADLPRIHAVIIRSALQTTYVISLDEEICDLLKVLLAVPLIRDFPTDYAFAYDWNQRDERNKRREACIPVIPDSLAHCKTLLPEGAPSYRPPPGAYRANIFHSAGGEPYHQIVPLDCEVYQFQNCHLVQDPASASE